jgi:hypothetical protein
MWKIPYLVIKPPEVLFFLIEVLNGPPDIDNILLVVDFPASHQEEQTYNDKYYRKKGNNQ